MAATEENSLSSAGKGLIEEIKAQDLPKNPSPPDSIKHEAAVEEKKAPRDTRNRAGHWTCTHPGCDKVYTRRTSLRDHMRKHLNQQFTCPIEGCCSKFTEKRNVMKHLEYVHKLTSSQKSYQAAKANV